MNEWTRWSKPGKGELTDWHVVAHDDDVTECCGKRIPRGAERRFALARGVYAICTRATPRKNPFPFVIVFGPQRWLAPE